MFPPVELPGIIDPRTRSASAFEAPGARCYPARGRQTEARAVTGWLGRIGPRIGGGGVAANVAVALAAGAIGYRLLGSAGDGALPSSR